MTTMQQLLVDPKPDLLIECSADGVAWLTERFVFVRRELFKRPPKPRADPRFFRQDYTIPRAKVRSLVGVKWDDTRPLAATLYVLDGARERWAVMQSGPLMVCANQRVVRGLFECGLVPRLDKDARIVWYRLAGKRPRVFAVQMPTYPWVGDLARIIQEAP